MREWLSSLAIARVPEIALGLALGYTLANLAEYVARVPVSVVAQHIGSYPFGTDDDVLGLLDLYSAPYALNVTIGDTVIGYGEFLVTMLALGLVALIAFFVVRRRARVLATCPFCASLIPRESRHCAYCGSGIAPAES